MAERIAGIVLAGGRGTRMGRDKAAIEIAGSSLLQRTALRLAGAVDEVVVVGRSGQQLPALDLPVPVRIVHDRYPNTGPLGGIATGMQASEAAVFVAVACDMPLLEGELVRRLVALREEVDAVVPVGPDGHDQPLCAVYGRACLVAIERCLHERSFRVTSFYTRCRVRRVPVDDALPFSNVNTPDDLARIGELLGREAAAAADDPGV